MADQPWDVFVSYAHADDEPPMGAAKGWVTTLADELRKVLRRKLGVREARIFMDHQLAGNESLTESLLAAIRGSRTLLLLMSPGYRKSSWCQRELGRFLEAQTERNHRDHVFVLETEPLDRAGWHPALKELIPIRFWHRESEDKGPRRMGYPVPNLDEDNPYWRNLNELAHLIARQLEDLDAPPQEFPTKVWLAEPTEDLLDEHESVAAALRQQGFLVVPTSPLPRDGQEAYLQALQGGLDQASLGVQLLGPKEGHRPAWGDRSFVALQAEAADEAARGRGLRVLRWRSLSIDLDRVTTANYRDLLTDESVLPQKLEDFKQEVLRALSRRTTSMLRTDSTAAQHVDAEALERVSTGIRDLSVRHKTSATVSQPLRVFLCHSSTDKPAVRVLCKRLHDDGFLPWLDEEELLGGQTWDVEIRKAVKAADAVVVCLSRETTTKAGYLQKELRFALDRAQEQPEGTIYIIPVKLEECSVPERLTELQWVSLFEESGYNRLLRSLRARAGALGLESRAKVWLAEPTEDLLDEHEAVAASLRQQGFLVVPAAPLPRAGREPYLRAVHDSLDRALLGVQLLGPNEGHRPTWEDRSFVALQAAAADEVARTRGLRVLRWRSRDLDLGRVTNADYRALLTGGSVLAQGLEEFKQEIVRAFDNRAKAPAPSSLPEPAGAPHVYVNAEAVDHDLGRRVLEALADLGATSALTPIVSRQDAPDQIRRAQQDHLTVCDGVVLVYGQVPAEWVHSQWAFAHKQRRDLRTAVLDGPPPEKPPVDLRGPGILLLDCRAGFDPVVLRDFVQTLRPGTPRA